jgi:hypothetical protein
MSSLKILDYKDWFPKPLRSHSEVPRLRTWLFRGSRLMMVRFRIFQVYDGIEVYHTAILISTVSTVFNKLQEIFKLY